jgi:hypothetical protein
MFEPGERLTVVTFPRFLGELFKQSGMFPDVQFTPEYPREPVKGDSIVWKVVRRVPGAGRMRERKPRIRHVKYKPRIGEAVVHWAQVFTVIYQFDVISASNTRADELMEKFEQFMLLCAEHLSARGVWRCLFEEQIESDLLQIPQPLAVRSLRYRVVLESVIEVPVPVVQSFNLRVSGGETEEVVQIVRSSGNAEELDITDCAVVFGVYDRDPSEDGAMEYVCGIDWTLYKAPDSGVLYILWLEDGISPPVGSTYYVKVGIKNIVERAEIT